MTCAEARAWLSLRQPLPLEAGAGLTAHVAEHVHDCPDCAAFTSRAAAFDAAVGKAMRQVPVPAGLKARLVVQAENARRAHARQRLFRVAAPLAACLLIGVLYGHFHSQQLPANPVLLAQVQRWVETDLETAPRLPLLPSDAHRHLPSEIRERWNLSCQTACYQTRYQGRWVAVLEFRHGASQAVVVLVPPEQVDPQQLQQFPPRYPTDHRVLANREPDEYVALVVIRAGQYNDFLKPPLLPSGA